MKHLQGFAMAVAVSAALVGCADSAPLKQNTQQVQETQKEVSDEGEGGVSKTEQAEHDAEAEKTVNVEKETKVKKQKRTRSEVAAYLNSYAPPQELSDDLADGIVLLEGDFYQLPAPVQAFYDNGWHWTSWESDYLVLERGDKCMKVWTSFSEYNEIDNRIVTGFSLKAEDEWEGIVAGGLTTGSTEEDVKALLEKSSVQDIFVQDTGDKNGYRCELGNDYDNFYAYCSKETGKVTTISIGILSYNEENLAD